MKKNHLPDKFITVLIYLCSDKLLYIVLKGYNWFASFVHNSDMTIGLQTITMFIQNFISSVFHCHLRL